MRLPIRTALAGALLAACSWGGAPPATATTLSGEAAAPLAAPRPPATVLVFQRDDCPNGNRYAPTVERLHQQFAARGVAFWLVYPDPDTNADEVRAHLATYGHTAPALLDPHHALVDLAGATVTPEAAVFDADGRRTYRGRIDDRFADFGKTRQAPTTHDLADALEATLAGTPVEPAETQAVGCYIGDLR